MIDQIVSYCIIILRTGQGTGRAGQALNPVITSYDVTGSTGQALNSVITLYDVTGPTRQAFNLYSNSQLTTLHLLTTYQLTTYYFTPVPILWIMRVGGGP